MNLTIISAAIVLMAVAGYAFGDYGDYDPSNIFGGFGGQDGQFNNDNGFQPQTDNPGSFGNPGTGTMIDFGQGQGPNQGEGMFGLGPQGPPPTPFDQGSDDGSPLAAPPPPPPAPTRPADDGSQGSPSAGTVDQSPTAGSSNTPTPPAVNQVNPAAAPAPASALPAAPNQADSPPAAAAANSSPPPPPSTPTPTPTPTVAGTTTNGVTQDNPLSDLLNLAAGNPQDQDPQNSDSN